MVCVPTVVQERRRIKRRIANRESARRVRARRQGTLEEMLQRVRCELPIAWAEGLKSPAPYRWVSKPWQALLWPCAGREGCDDSHGIPESSKRVKVRCSVIKGCNTCVGGSACERLEHAVIMPGLGRVGC